MRPGLPTGRTRRQAPGGLKHNDRLPPGPRGHKVPGGQPFDSSSSKRLPKEPPPNCRGQGGATERLPGITWPQPAPLSWAHGGLPQPPSLVLEQPLLCPHPRPPGQRRPPWWQPEHILPWQEMARAQKPPFPLPRKEAKLQRKGLCSCSGSPSFLGTSHPPAQQGLMPRAAA